MLRAGARPNGRRSLMAGDPAATDGPVLARGVMLMCVLPPLEGWDEYQHVAYVHSMHETGRRPVYGEAVVPRALLESV